MLDNKFTVSELVDLALIVPEVGAVNFNILHTVLKTIVVEMGIEGLKPLCYIQDPVIAQAAVTKAKMKATPGVAKRAESVTSLRDLKDRLKTVTGRSQESVADVGGAGGSDTARDEVEVDEASAVPQENEEQETVVDDKSGETATTSEATEPVDDGPVEATPVSEEAVDGSVETDQTVKVPDQAAEGSVEADQAVEVTDQAAKESVATDEAVEVPDQAAEESVDADESSPLVESSTEKQAETVEEDRDTLSDVASASMEAPPDAQMQETADNGPFDAFHFAAEQAERSAEAARKSHVFGMATGFETLAEDAVSVSSPTRAKVLTADELLNADPIKMMTEVWRAININRRMDGAEAGLRELSSILDELFDKMESMEVQNKAVLEQAESAVSDSQELVKKIEELDEKSESLQLLMDTANEEFKQEMHKNEEAVKQAHQEQEEINSVLQTSMDQQQVALQELHENVAYKKDVEELHEIVIEDLTENVKELKKRIKDVKDMMVSKEDFGELVERTNVIEDVKIDRDELGPLLKPGFIDSFLADISKLKEDFIKVDKKLLSTAENLESLTDRIDTDIVKTIESNFTELSKMIEDINAKLENLDPDEIYDSMARLEDQAEKLSEDLEDLKTASEQREQEIKSKLRKLDFMLADIEKLKETKADINKVKELLDLKADLESLSAKVDEDEFITAITDIKQSIDRVAVKLKMNEEHVNGQILDIKRELTLKLYSEDFPTLIEPINNRIKALIYGLRRVKEIARTNLFPDAPGIVKCFSCARGAELAGSKYQDSKTKEVHSPWGGGEARSINKKGSKDTVFRLPEISDCDYVKELPPHKPTITDPLHLPFLFASSKPNIGLPHEKKRNVIDRELASYFATKPVRSCGGEYTRTRPHQKGVSFVNLLLPGTTKSDIALKGTDKHMYKGTLYEDQDGDSTLPEVSRKKPVTKKSEIASLNEPRRRKGFIKPVMKSLKEKEESSRKGILMPSVVSLCVNNQIVEKDSPLITSGRTFGVPSELYDRARKSAM